jgi:hypothetical protein
MRSNEVTIESVSFDRMILRDSAILSLVCRCTLSLDVLEWICALPFVWTITAQLECNVTQSASESISSPSDSFAYDSFVKRLTYFVAHCRSFA